MTYSKPEVTRLASSLEAIQNDTKENPHISDSVSPFLEFTASAYQADE